MKTTKELRQAFNTVDTATACAHLTDDEREKSNAALFAVRDHAPYCARSCN